MNGKTDVISLRQLMVLLFTALLSPWVAVLPGWTAATADKASWLTGLVAVPVLLGMGYVFTRLFRQAPEGSGLAEIFQQVLGKPLGICLTTIYIGWGLVLLVLVARGYGQRMTSAGYSNVSAEVFVLLLLGLVLWMGRKKLAGLARSVEIFYLVLVVVLAFVLLFALWDIKLERVLPVWSADIPGVLAASYVPVAVCSLGVYGAFLGKQVVRPEKPAWMGWVWAAAAVMTLLQVGVLAQLGAGLSSQLTDPFFEVARGVGVTGAFQRVESVVIALWGLSDFALLGLLLFACSSMIKSIIGERGSRWLPYIVVGLTVIGAIWVLPEELSLSTLAEYSLLGNVALGIGVPIGILVVQSVRLGKKGR